MPQITITLTDTPAGGVAVHSDFRPAAGSKCSPAQVAALEAQAAALEIINRTSRDYGMPAPSFGGVPVYGVDIDAVHRTRDNVIAGGTDL